MSRFFKPFYEMSSWPVAKPNMRVSRGRVGIPEPSLVAFANSTKLSYPANDFFISNASF